MSPQPGFEENPQTESQPNITNVPRASAEADRIKTVHTFIAVCSLGIIGCFFLPWITLFLGAPSAYQLQELPTNEVKLLWFIPGTALLPLFALLAKQAVAPMSQIAGAAPFVALLYYVAKFGTDLFQSLQVGAYLTLLFGVVLSVLPHVLSKSKP